MAAGAVSIDLKEINGLAELLNKVRLSAQDRQQLLLDIGTEIKSQTQDRLASPDKKDPEGNPWQAIAEKTRRYYEKKFPAAKPPLWREGGLLDSVEFQMPDSWSVLIGATEEYAATHQFGRPEVNIVPRPYLGISGENAADILFITQKFLAERFP
jgi:phage gpG-like protein